MNWKFWQRKVKSDFEPQEFSDVKEDSEIAKAAEAYRNLQRKCGGELDWRSFLAGWNERGVK